jgi:hypothetical protein
LLRIGIRDRTLRFDEVQVAAQTERHNQQSHRRRSTSHLSPLPPAIDARAENQAGYEQQ